MSVVRRTPRPARDAPVQRHAQLQHRTPGPFGALLADERVTVELIADGHHLHRDILTLVGAAARGRVAATDATAATDWLTGPTGSAANRWRSRPAASPWPGARRCRQRPDDGPRPPDARRCGWSITDAVTAVTRTPADSVQAAAKGRLAVGADADLVVLDRDLHVAAVVAGGGVAHDPGGLFAAAGA